MSERTTKRNGKGNEMKIGGAGGKYDDPTFDEKEV